MPQKKRMDATLIGGSSGPLEQGPEVEQDADVARRDLGERLLKAIQSGDGKQVFAAIEDCYSLIEALEDMAEMESEG
jgi:hypothetical protein